MIPSVVAHLHSKSEYTQKQVIFSPTESHAVGMNSRNMKCSIVSGTSSKALLYSFVSVVTVQKDESALM